MNQIHMLYSVVLICYFDVIQHLLQLSIEIKVN